MELVDRRDVQELFALAQRLHNGRNIDAVVAAESKALGEQLKGDTDLLIRFTVKRQDFTTWLVESEEFAEACWVKHVLPALHLASDAAFADAVGTSARVRVARTDAPEHSDDEEDDLPHWDIEDPKQLADAITEDLSSRAADMTWMQGDIDNMTADARRDVIDALFAYPPDDDKVTDEYLLALARLYTPSMVLYHAFRVNVELQAAQRMQNVADAMRNAQ